MEQRPTSEGEQQRIEEEHKVVQRRVLSTDFRNPEERMKFEGPLNFIILNAPLFRFFSEHLPRNLSKAWDASYGEGDVFDTQAVNQLDEHYKKFREEILSTLASFDPDTFTALTEAVEKEDIDGATRILQTFFASRDNIAHEEDKVA